MNDWKQGRDDDRQVVLGLLCNVGAVKECQIHKGSYYEGSTDIEEAVEFVAERVAAGEAKGLGGYDADDLAELAEEVYREYAGETKCSYPNCVEALLGEPPDEPCKPASMTTRGVDKTSKVVVAAPPRKEVASLAVAAARWVSRAPRDVEKVATECWLLPLPVRLRAVAECARRLRARAPRRLFGLPADTAAMRLHSLLGALSAGIEIRRSPVLGPDGAPVSPPAFEEWGEWRDGSEAGAMARLRAEAEKLFDLTAFSHGLPDDPRSPEAMDNAVVAAAERLLRLVAGD